MLQIRINHVLHGFLIAAILRSHNNRKALVQVGPRFNQTGVMQRTQTLIFLCHRIQIIHAAVQQLLRLTLYLILNNVRMHVVPLQRRLGAYDADVLGGHVTGVDTGAPHTAYSAVFVTHQHVSVVLQRITGAYKCLTVTQNLLQLLIRTDELRHVIGMGGQVAQNECLAYLGRIYTPLLTLRLYVAFRIAAKAVCIAQVDHIDLAQLAGGYHRAHLLQQFETGEAVGYSDNLALFLSQLLNFLTLLCFKEQRLLTDNVQASFQRSLGYFVMQEVRSCYVNHFDAVLALCLCFEHGLVIRIAAILIHAQVAAKLLAALCVYVECSSLQNKRGVVAHSAQTMLIAYLRGLASAYDTPTERSVNQFLANVHNSYFLSCFSLCFKIT